MTPVNIVVRGSSASLKQDHEHHPLCTHCSRWKATFSEFGVLVFATHTNNQSPSPGISNLTTLTFRVITSLLEVWAVHCWAGGGKKRLCLLWLAPSVLNHKSLLFSLYYLIMTFLLPLLIVLLALIANVSGSNLRCKLYYFFFFLSFPYMTSSL